eukprot:2428126-Amphidinium_carterae.2
MSRLASCTSTPGSWVCHQRMRRATCLCLGCSAGGCHSPEQVALTHLWSCISLLSKAMLRSGNCLETVAKGEHCMRCPAAMACGMSNTRPLLTSFHTCLYTCSRASNAELCGFAACPCRCSEPNVERAGTPLSCIQRR